MANRKDLDIDAMTAKLLDRKSELESLIATHEDDARPVEVDQQRVGRLSRIDAIQEQAMAAETERRRDAEIHRIEAALAKIESGDYGYCAVCDEEISVKRLELDPAVTLCIKCAAAGERR
jgi:DnaK suppressor protein